MKHHVLLLGAAAAAALSGCLLLHPVRGSGNPVTTSFDVGDFSRIAVSHACKASVVPDTVTSLEVTCDDNVLDYLEVVPNGRDSVSIGLKPGVWYLGVTFAAEVHVPRLDTLDLSGASEAQVAPGFTSTDPLMLTLSGASRADLASVSCGALVAELSGASSITVAGTADGERLILSGASEAHLLDLASSSASAGLSGGSQCWLDVGSGTVDVTASGGSTLYYRGSPALGAVDLSGGSRLARVN